MKIILFSILFLFSITNLFLEEDYYEHSYVGTHNLSAVKTPNETVTGEKLDGIVTVLKSSGNLFLVGQNTNSVCIILSKSL